MMHKMDGLLCGEVREEPEVSDLTSGVDGGAVRCAEEHGKVWVWGQDEVFDFRLI